ncbi:unnamed protein product [Rotaria socialis]
MEVFFLSARSLKRVHNDDPGCFDCRMKYLNWLKKVDEDFDHLKERDVNQDENSDNAMETDVDGGNKSDKCSVTEQHVKGDTSEIAIRVSRCTKSHRSCIVCELSDETCKVLSKQQRTLIFVKRGIFISEDARCCPSHIYNKQLNFDSLCQIRGTHFDKLVFDANRLEEIIADFRLIVDNLKTFDFDDPYSLSDMDYYNITGLHKDEFDIVVDSVVSMRESRIRSKRTTTALFCAKMRLGLSNSVLSTMFHIKDDKVVSRIIHQVTEALMKNFVPKHTGFRHVSRQTVLEQHQTLKANMLLTSNNQQVVVVMDGTYLYLQKSANNELQRRNYSTHKHRHLIKPMIITTRSGYILSVLGPFFGDYKNNDANIITHCLLTNEDDMLNWLQDDDIIILDRGFRDAAPTMRTLGFHVQMPRFLNGKKQFTTEEANQSRLVTANRWVVESGTYQIRMAKSYILEHITTSILNDDDLEFIVELCPKQSDLVRVRFQSGHSNNKCHTATVQFDETVINPIVGYYCTCISGSREVGCCSHVAAVLWHRGVQRAAINPATDPLSAVNSMQSVHDSIYHTFADEEPDDDNHIRYSLYSNDLDDTSTRAHSDDE